MDTDATWSAVYARIIHERLLQRPILSPGAAFFIRFPARGGSSASDEERQL
jgi:hypothetical protein